MEAIEFKLYITGHSARSDQAIGNLRRLCDELLGGNCAVEVIDVLEEPERAERDRILTTPTLIKARPGPQRRVTGDLSDSGRLVAALSIEGLQTWTEPPSP